MCRCNNLPIDKLADCHITQLFIMLEKLKEKVFRANLDLVKHGLVILHGEMFLPSIVKQVW